MNIFFSMRHSGALRNFGSTVRELARRGHRIHLAFMMVSKHGDRRLLLELTQECPDITYGKVKTPRELRRDLARVVRAAADYARYGAPEYRRARALRKRAGRNVPAVRRLLSLPLLRAPAGWRLVSSLLAAIERALPIDPVVIHAIADRMPDVVLVTPLVDIGSSQVEYVKAARALGIPTGLCVHSWDNLTNKGLMRAVPDRVFVWNRAQKREAVALHGADPAQVVVTGAPVFDQWFSRGPSTSREEYCRAVALPPEKPFFAYLCSSKFIAAEEIDFVERWIRAVRCAPDPRVREAGILIRPHPYNRQRWERIDVAELGPVVLWPRRGQDPIDDESKNGYFDTLYHSAAAVGINTTAQIEAGIVGRPVYSIRVPEYAGTQEGTLHFQYLVSEHGGLLHLADSLEDHARALAGALDRADEDARRLRKFVGGFVRPCGLDVAVTPLLADAIEELARLPVPGAVRKSAGGIVTRPAPVPVAVRAAFVRFTGRRSEARSRPIRSVARKSK